MISLPLFIAGALISVDYQKGASYKGEWISYGICSSRVRSTFQ